MQQDLNGPQWCCEGPDPSTNHIESPQISAKLSGCYETNQLVAYCMRQKMRWGAAPTCCFVRVYLSFCHVCLIGWKYKCYIVKEFIEVDELENVEQR